MKTVIVTGGRNYNDFEKIAHVLALIKPALVIQGGASGADKLAKAWAASNNVPYITYFADWDKHGKAAGPIRNREMLHAYPSAILIAFPGGAGTADCTKAAIERKHIVLQVK